MKEQIRDTEFSFGDKITCLHSPELEGIVRAITFYDTGCVYYKIVKSGGTEDYIDSNCAKLISKAVIEYKAVPVIRWELNSTEPIKK